MYSTIGKSLCFDLRINLNNIFFIIGRFLSWLGSRILTFGNLFIYLFIYHNTQAKFTLSHDCSDITDMGLHLECLSQISRQPPATHNAELRS